MKFQRAMIGSEDPDALGAFYTKVLGEPGFQRWHLVRLEAAPN